MLKLNRHSGEAIIIEGDIVVRVMEINGNQVKLGIKAPDEVDVWREEIWERIQREKGDD